MSVHHINDHDEDSEELMLAMEDDHGGGGHEDSEGIWLMSYADMMTLLMGFFALLTSMGSFEEEKFAAVGDEVAKYYGGKIEKPFDGLEKAIKKIVKSKGLEDQVKIKSNKVTMTMTFEGTLFFDSGSIKLKNTAEDLMKEIVSILDQEAADKNFLIEGHTDSNPINKGIIASNWELSALRATNVARLFEKKGFKRTQIMTIGLGETRPLEDEQVKDVKLKKIAQDKNRRVVVKIMNKLPL